MPYIITYKQVKGEQTQHEWWTGFGWSARRSQAERFKDKHQAARIAHELTTTQRPAITVINATTYQEEK